MNQATERPDAVESPPAEPAGVAEEKPRSTAKKRAAAAVEKRAEAAAETEAEAILEEKEPAPTVEPVPTSEYVAPLAEAGPPAGQPGPIVAARPERKRHGRYVPRRKVCAFCVDHVDKIDYKEVAKLRRYLSDRGKIEPRRKTGTCAKHQRRLTIALKRARHLALLPYTAEHIRLAGAFAPRS
jgi:small subunit ribosomal protein S18